MDISQFRKHLQEVEGKLVHPQATAMFEDKKTSGQSLEETISEAMYGKMKMKKEMMHDKKKMKDEEYGKKKMKDEEYGKKMKKMN
tara:strand:- start:1083 stop:1337 length:255 start_codon:yes stop_codon:yes gene_type:complete